MAYLKRRNYVLGGVDLGDENMNGGNAVETVDAVADVQPVGNGAPAGAGSFNLFGISVQPLYLLGGAVAGYFLGEKDDALRNAALGATAGVVLSYFINRSGV